METKSETSAKPAKTAPKAEPKAAAKEPEASKGKSAKDAFGKFFRSKVKEQLQDRWWFLLPVRVQRGLKLDTGPRQLEAGLSAGSSCHEQKLVCL